VLVTDWARESNDLARTDVYKKLNIPNHTAPLGQCAVGIAKVNVNQAYLDRKCSRCRTQLMRGWNSTVENHNDICAGNGAQWTRAAGAAGDEGSQITSSGTF